MKKRVLSFLLVLCMLLSMFSVFGVSAQTAEGAETGDNLSKNENSDAPSSFYDLYVTDGLVAFYDAFDTASDVLDLENGKWYAKLYNATTGEFEKTSDDAYTAIIGGGVYSEDVAAPNLTGWVKGEKGFSYYTNQSIGANKISVPVSLISSLNKYTVEFVGRVDLRAVHDAAQSTGTVSKNTKDGITTYTISGLEYPAKPQFAYYTVTLKGEADAEVALNINGKDVKVTLDANGNGTYMAKHSATDPYIIKAPEAVELAFSADKALNSQMMSNSAFVFGTLHCTHWTNLLGDNDWGNGAGKCRWYTGSADWGAHNGKGDTYGGDWEDSSMFVSNNGVTNTMRVEASKSANGESYVVTYGSSSLNVGGNKAFADYKFDLLSNTCGAAFAIRLYNRQLTADEKALNIFIDKMIYNGVDFDAYMALAEDHKELYMTAVTALSFDDGHDAYMAALEGINEFAKKEAAMREMSDYDELYVGADGSKTASGGSLIALFSAYKDNDLSLDLGNKAWRDKVAKNDIVLNGTMYNAETGEGYWKARVDGGLGYDINVTKSSDGFTSGSHFSGAANVSMTLNPELISSPDFTVEYAVRYDAIGLLSGNELVGTYTGPQTFGDGVHRTPSDIIGLMKNYAPRAGTFDNINRGTRWYVGNVATGWGDSGYDGQMWSDNSRAGYDIFVQTITRDEVAQPDNVYDATYTIYKDAAQKVAGTYSTANPETKVDSNGKIVPSGTYYYKDATGYSFMLFRQIPVSVYAIRVYDATLTIAEMQHNRFIDLAAYCGADLTQYHSMNPNERAIVESMMAGIGFISDSTEFDTIFNEVYNALNNEFDMNTTLYVTDGLEILLTSYESMNSGMLATDAGITWFNAVEKGTYGTLRGAEWKLNPTGGATIVKNYDAFMKDRSFGLYFGAEMLPEEDYTMELVANPVGITNDDGTRYIDGVTMYGLHYDNGFGIGPLRALQFVSYRPTGKDGQLEKDWVYQHQKNAWVASGHKARFQDTSWKNLGLDQILTYTISLDMEESTANYRFLQDNKQIGSFKIG